jgi:predicted RNA-binding Zn ribbon-like protein
MYTGPLLGQPLAIELHNTLHAGGDGLTDAPAWLEAVGVSGTVRPDELVELRAAVREALHAAHEGREIPAAAVAELNRRSVASPRSLVLEHGAVRVRHHGATATDVVLGEIATSAIELVTGESDLRVCGAPRCVLMFVKDHPRREWCSNACGNRARQARHYARTQAARSGPSSPPGR